MEVAKCLPRGVGYRYKSTEMLAIAWNHRMTENVAMLKTKASKVPQNAGEAGFSET